MTSLAAAHAVDVAALASGKDHGDENFPVASIILGKPYRAPIMAYYRFARAADDVADNEATSAETKLALLAAMRASLTGEDNGNAEAVALRAVMLARGIPLDHGLDLLTAFERDCRQSRYQSWDELIDYCRYSAMPVGRYVLDVHGEDRATWPGNDALCAALQVINHLQDCGKDYRGIDRVYIPMPMLAAAGVPVEALGAERASPALRGVILALAERTRELLRESAAFSAQIRNRRLAVNVAIIQRLAENLVEMLLTRDPLSERVHHGKAETLWLAGSAAIHRLVRGR